MGSGKTGKGGGEPPKESVRDRLLEAGTEEFLLRGYRAASLRRICERAGVTTGALYFLFQNKEDLFSQIVGRPLELFARMAERNIRLEYENLDASAQTEEEIITFLLCYRRECLLLLEKAEGTRYEGFIETYQGKLEEVFGRFFRKHTGREPDPKLMHLLVAMRIKGCLELIEGDYEEEEARRLAGEMACYADAGFRALTGAKVSETPGKTEDRS